MAGASTLPVVGNSTVNMAYPNNVFVSIPNVGVGVTANISMLNNIENFSSNVLDHIINGSPKNNGKITGYHVNDNGYGIIDKSTMLYDSSTGIYQATVYNVMTGKPKAGNGGVSTFFPDTWSNQQMVDAVNQAYVNKDRINTSNWWQAQSIDGVYIKMYINPLDQKIESAFPTFNGN
ncbi:MAG: EndoU domain-containing protein [Sebaldella sp.]|nr:EndoU domain-containing protein [Sebaldella sp.]